MEHKHKIKTSKGITYCSACGRKDPSTYETCYYYDYKHSFKVQSDGSIICEKCGREDSSYNCFGDGHNHHYKKMGDGRIICTKCGMEYNYATYNCSGHEHNHNFDIDKNGNVVCKKCGKEYSYAYYYCDPSQKPKREKATKSYEKLVANLYIKAEPYRVNFLAGLVCIKGGWSRTCLKGRVGVEKKIIQNMREEIKAEYESIKSYSIDRVQAYLYENFSKAKDNKEKAIILTMAADLINDRNQRLLVSKALHYKDGVWETLDEHVDFYALNN